MSSRPERRDEVWEFEGVVQGGVRRAARPGPPSRPSPRPGAGAPVEEALPGEVVDELVAAVGKARAPRLAERLAAAARAYERDRYTDALRMTRVLVREAPDAPGARELHGLVCYRLGRWREAVTHLEAARAAGDDPSQIPVLMDCHRAMGHRRVVAALWEELRASSPPPDVLVEGRLVRAEDLADRGQIDEAIALVAGAGGARNLRHPGDRHLRQWYVLADLYERAGDVPRARDLFARVVAADPELADAALRLGMLGQPRRAPRSRARRAVAPGGRGPSGSRAGERAPRR